MSKEETTKHIQNVRRKIDVIMDHLYNRGRHHDFSKLEEPEASTFDEYGPKLHSQTYGSEEYKESLKEMNVALDHHYKHNRHHPEYHQDGIDGMDLVDILEMFCDWVAATERHADGDIEKSIVINKQRFGMSDQLTQIFLNTVKYFKGNIRHEDTP